MGKIISDDTKEEKEIKDGEPIRPACRELGVVFGCEIGNCGVCQIEIIEGKENLNELNEKEKALMMDEENRLACQAKFKGDGEVRFRY